MTRVEDQYPFDRNLRAAIIRIGTVAGVSADGSKVDVTIPGGVLASCPIADNIAAPAGKRVVVLLDRDAAVVICAIKPST